MSTLCHATRQNTQQERLSVKVELTHGGPATAVALARATGDVLAL